MSVPRKRDKHKAPALIGYARVSTEEQNLSLQREALEAAGCSAIFQDKASGADNGRKGLASALRRCGDGDVLVVWKLDRLGRSLFDLVETVQRLDARGAGLKVLTGQGATIDTTLPEGRLIFAIFATLAEFERELISERTRAGMQSARRRGVILGRPRKLSEEQIALAQSLLESGKATREALSAMFGVDVSTLHRALKRYEDDAGDTI